MIDEETHTVGGTRELPLALLEWSMLTNLILAQNPCDDCCVLHFTVSKFRRNKE